jgi:alkyl hydroperoxide reductase subunit AhpC
MRSGAIAARQTTKNPGFLQAFSRCSSSSDARTRLSNAPPLARGARPADANAFDEGTTMALSIGSMVPDFSAVTTAGPIRFHDWIGDSWCVLFSHPKDFTPVCTTELGRLARLKPEFDRRKVKIIGLSVDAVDDHRRWAADIERSQGATPNYPIIADGDLAVAKVFGMLPADAADGATARSAADNQTVRTVFVIAPNKTIRLMIAYPMTTGRNFDELLRVIDSLQLTDRHKVATPVDWRPGEDVIILASISDETARTMFPRGWRAPLPYLRITPPPG